MLPLDVGAAMNAFTFIWNDVERYSNVVIHRRILYSLEGLKHNFTEQCYFLLSLYHLSLRCFQKNLFLQVTVGVVIFGIKMYQFISAVSLLDHKRLQLVQDSCIRMIERTILA